VTRPFFATYGNKTLFSTPADTTGNLVCPSRDNRGDEEPFTTKTRFSGVGTIYLKPGCFIEMPDGLQIAAHYQTNLATDLGTSTMNQAFEYLPKLENYTFSVNKTNLFEDNDLPSMSEEDMELNTIQHLTKLATDPDEMIIHIVRFAIILVVVLVIFIIVYCVCPKFRLWFKACCFVNNPRKFWTEKGYELPTFQRVKQLKTKVTGSNPVRRYSDFISKQAEAFRLRNAERDLQDLDDPKLHELLKEKREACEAALRDMPKPVAATAPQVDVIEVAPQPYQHYPTLQHHYVNRESMVFEPTPILVTSKITH
jgi:hypothetical protein